MQKYFSKDEYNSLIEETNVGFVHYFDYSLHHLKTIDEISHLSFDEFLPYMEKIKLLVKQSFEHEWVLFSAHYHSFQEFVYKYKQAFEIEKVVNVAHVDSTLGVKIITKSNCTRIIYYSFENGEWIPTISPNYSQEFSEKLRNLGLQVLNHPKVKLKKLFAMK